MNKGQLPTNQCATLKTWEWPGDQARCVCMRGCVIVCVCVCVCVCVHVFIFGGSFVC